MKCKWLYRHDFKSTCTFKPKKVSITQVDDGESPQSKIFSIGSRSVNHPQPKSIQHIYLFNTSCKIRAKSWMIYGWMGTSGYSRNFTTWDGSRLAHKSRTKSRCTDFISLWCQIRLILDQIRQQGYSFIFWSEWVSCLKSSVSLSPRSLINKYKLPPRAVWWIQNKNIILSSKFTSSFGRITLWAS